jgi:hypothetical protein
MAFASRLVVIFGCLVVFPLAGCAANQGLAVDTSDPIWNPPGQGELAVADSPEAPAPKRSPRARAAQQPNHAAISGEALRTRRSQHR